MPRTGAGAGADVGARCASTRLTAALPASRWSDKTVEASEPLLSGRDNDALPGAPGRRSRPGPGRGGGRSKAILHCHSLPGAATGPAGHGQVPDRAKSQFSGELTRRVRDRAWPAARTEQCSPGAARRHWPRSSCCTSTASSLRWIATSTLASGRDRATCAASHQCPVSAFIQPLCQTGQARRCTRSRHYLNVRRSEANE